MSGTGEVLLEETWHYVYEEPQSLKKLTNNSSLLKYGLQFIFFSVRTLKLKILLTCFGVAHVGRCSSIMFTALIFFLYLIWSI